MRLHSLELIRYGKFTAQALTFPSSACDFHLIVGANEAGKSTLRRAVSDLLFGMPLRSDMDFVHPLAELRLGAVIESAAGRLAFQRSRGRKSLRRPDDAVLPDAALFEHLGSTSEALFKRMFCLDLAGLLEGGKTILDASDDVGRLLFQSASGMAGLGAVRDALLEEANKLYAPRRSADRAFYQALDRLDAAKGELRNLTVNTRQWTTAMARVEALQAAQHEGAEHYKTLSVSRQHLERVRRIAPRVAQLHEVQVQLQPLQGGWTDFPEDAGQRLAEAEVATATQSTMLKIHHDALASLQLQLAALAPDETVLAQAAAVEALIAQGHACLQHRQKIMRSEQEVAALLCDAAACAVQLAWPAEEAGMRARLPSLLALKTLSLLMQERGGLLQAQLSAGGSRDRAQLALDRLQQQHAAPSALPLAPTLTVALQEAQALKSSAARQRALQAAQVQAVARLETALALLSVWRRDVPALAALALPAEEQLAALKVERAAWVSTLEAARQQQLQVQEQARQSALALAQFTASHSVVTHDDVRQARTARDEQWRRLKHEPESMSLGAPLLDRAIEEADRLVDSQRDHAADSAELLSLRQTQARDAAAAQARAQHCIDARKRLQEFDSRWTEQARAMGLPGMMMLDLSGWLAQRKVALDAESALQVKESELEAERAIQAEAITQLRAALQASGAAVAADDRLGDLCASAERLIDVQRVAKADAELRAVQLADAQREWDHHEQAWGTSSAVVAQWQARWTGAVSDAGLAGDWLTPDSARGAIELAGQVVDLLGQVDNLRQHRIRVMQQELADFDTSAQALHPILGPPDQAEDAFSWAQALVQRLHLALQTQQARSRLAGEVRSSDDQARAASVSLAATRASLASLFALAHGKTNSQDDSQDDSEDHSLLRARIAQSDRHRALVGDLQRVRQAIVEQGDGLSLDALIAEAGGAEPESLKPRLEALNTQLLAAMEQQAGLATELAQAQADLGKIQGGADAAVAESKRGEALAQLGESAERYITVATGHRLLRWAIDRYRERKQGPLLQRASSLFSRLTLARFDRLVPDFDVTPPRLVAVRSSGERVGMEGLSEGTRDQLFLALRLAALELQIEGDRALPFIADDLFVNFHDSRSRAGLAALAELSRKTQVIFLTHHEHLVQVARECVGPELNVIELG